MLRKRRTAWHFMRSKPPKLCNIDFFLKKTLEKRDTSWSIFFMGQYASTSLIEKFMLVMFS